MCDFALARKLRGARTVELSEAATAEERLLHVHSELTKSRICSKIHKVIPCRRKSLLES